MADLRYDMSQFYPMKAAFEQILGNRAYRTLKETGSLSDWKKETKKLLKAIGISITETVKVADEKFFEQIHSELEHGERLVSSSKEIAELFAALAATLTKLVFLQIGYIPSRHDAETVPLRPQYWVLNRVRSVQYVQSAEQKRTALRIGGSKNVAS
jgi:hypothetical protein